MPSITREETGSLEARLHLTITRNELEDIMRKGLLEYQRKAQLKGFRKGKTPLPFLRKMYGDAILYDRIQRNIDESLDHYVKDNQLRLLGSVLPVEDQPPLPLTADSLQDLNLSFEIGLAPEVSLQGVDKASTYKKYDIQLSEARIEEEWRKALKNGGKRQGAEGPVEADDVIRISAVEWSDKGPRKDGWQCPMTFLVGETDPTLKDRLLGLQKGATFLFRVQEVEPGKDPAELRKDLLQVEEGDDREIGNEFQGTLEEILRFAPAEPGQEFYDQYFGKDVVTNEDEARQELRKYITQYYDRQSEAILFRDFQDALLKANEIPLPEKFLKRWLRVRNEKLSQEEVEEQFPLFKENLRWTMIRDHVVRAFDLQVSEQEIINHFRQKLAGYFQFSVDPSFLDSMMGRLLKNQKSVEEAYESILADKVFETVREQVSLESVPLNEEAFDEMLKKANEELAERRKAQQLLERTHEHEHEHEHEHAHEHEHEDHTH